MLPFGVGVRPGIPWIRDVTRHEQSGLLAAPAEGIIYGRTGVAVGTVCSDGYVRLGGRRGLPCQYAHRVIFEAVHGEIPDGLEIDHLNGNKADNRIRNLEAVTKSENILRAIAMGLAPIGEQKSSAKLTDAVVREIRRTKKTKSLADWARELGVDRTTVRHARDGTTWRHVPLRSRSSGSSPKAGGHRRRSPTPHRSTPVSGTEGADEQVTSSSGDLADAEPKTTGGSNNE